MTKPLYPCRMNLNLSHSMKEEIEKQAKKEDISISNLLRKAVTDYLKEKEKGESRKRETIFNSDECQALLDLIDKASFKCLLKDLSTKMIILTDEEKEVYEKLKKQVSFTKGK